MLTHSKINNVIKEHVVLLDLEPQTLEKKVDFYYNPAAWTLTYLISPSLLSLARNFLMTARD